VAGHEIHTSSGAYLAGGTWTDASSRAYKHDIRALPASAAADALAVLNPVTFRYNDDEQQQHVGFIAEDVPELVAMKDRKGLSPMDIVAVLTKVVQEQKQQLGVQDQRLQAERARGDSMEERLQTLAAEVARLQARVPK
jgi:alcohol dehydrogenase YqhD (iron-dependent ADH family)